MGRFTLRDQVCIARLDFKLQLDQDELTVYLYRGKRLQLGRSRNSLRRPRLEGLYHAFECRIVSTKLTIMDDSILVGILDKQLAS